MTAAQGLIIDGTTVAAERTFTVIDPATGKGFAEAPNADQGDVDFALTAAKRAFGAWRRDETFRRVALKQMAETVESATDELALLLTQEQGKPLANARREVGIVAAWFRYFSDFDTTPEVIERSTGARLHVTRRPLGVVVAITPWNVPLGLASWKIAPALRAGNTVVVKPSPYTPLSTLRMIELLQRDLPPGVLSALSGTDELGPLLTEHPIPRKLSFTGSTATGRAVAQSALGDFKRVTLEMGGNDPAILLDCADPEQLADQLLGSAFANAGQVCIAVKRVYVPAALQSQLVEALTDRAQRIVVGPGIEPGTQMGPLNNATQRDVVVSMVDQARSRGARVTTGGAALDRPGFFYAPTIVTDISAGSALVDQEQFGPALPVVGYTDLDEVLSEVNDSSYGLGASVWATDLDRAALVARELDSGTVWVNHHGGVLPDQPFGGLKSSGLGVENGRWGYEAFTDIQVQHHPPGFQSRGQAT
jgi:acyl-CoA reductase-like NAD-dependent aldehyde dehydrogenase